MTAVLVLAALIPPAGASKPIGPGISPPTPTAARAERPRTYIDATYVPPSGRTLAVAAGGDFQGALDRASPGDVITLEAGAVYRGPFTLPAKSGPGWIVIRTSAADSELPPAGTRADPSFARIMPKLEATSGSAVQTAPGAHHYRFVGIEIRPARGAFLYNLVLLGDAGVAADRLPDHIIFDRCYLHGDPQKGTRRGIALNSRDTAVIDSWLADFKEAGADSQAIGGWNGPGPFKIVNNHLEASGENVMFGGAPPSIPLLVPSDIEIRDNHFSKPLAWKAGDPSHAGVRWTVKNLFELKNARRVLLEHNVLENNWADAQTGFGILFTVRTERDETPWAVVEDVIVANNVLRNSAAGVNILGIDEMSAKRGGRTSRVEITNNLFVDIGAAGLGGSGILFQILNGASNIRIEHNTAFHTGSIIAADLTPTSGLVFRDNIVEHNEYGVFGSGLGIGLPALEHYFPGFVFQKNVVAGNPVPRQYPPGNFYPPTIAGVGFVDYEGGNYRLGASSPFRGKGTDGTDPGADPALLPGARGAPVPRTAQP
jgi:hypothetical protein